jgi:ABC-type dipeptide/oligopeptide/nickel transport system permease component
MSYVLRRLITILPVLIGVATLSFFLLRLIPGDPVDLMLGEQALPADRDALRHELGLDLPLPAQYGKFMMGVATFDLGRSLQSRRPIAEQISERFPATLELTLAAMGFATVIGVCLGVIAAARRSTWMDRAAHLWSLFGLSAPAIWLGPLFVLLLAVKLDILPVSERGDWTHLILPSLTLGLSLSAILIQVTRASMLEALRSDYITVARAKGVSALRLYFKHAFANALNPVITILGLQFGALLTGTVIVETLFDWPGIGTLLYQAIQARDYPLVQGCVLFIAMVYSLVNLLTDLAYSAADPRIRLS